MQQSAVAKGSDPQSQLLMSGIASLAMLSPGQLLHVTDCDGTKLRLHARVVLWAGRRCQYGDTQSLAYQTMRALHAAILLVLAHRQGSSLPTSQAPACTAASLTCDVNQASPSVPVI